MTEKFIRERRIDISPTKSALLPFTRKYLTGFHLVIQLQNIERVSSIHFLGVTLDRCLAWKQHIDRLEQKANRFVNVLHSLSGIAWGPSTQSLLVFHRAVVRECIAYLLPLMHSLSASLEKRLSYVLARSLRVCLGVPRATSSSLVIVESREPTTRALRVQETAHHFLNLSAHFRDRSLARNITDRIGSRFCQVLTAHNIVTPPKVLWTLIFSTPPWTLPALNIHLDVAGIASKSTVSPLMAKQLTRSHIFDYHSTKLQIFTDGSTAPDSSTAIFTIPAIEAENGFRLSHPTSSTTAELHAILEAIIYEGQIADPRAWVICSDSKAAL